MTPVNETLAMNTATNTDGSRAVVLTIDGNTILVSAEVARGMASALIELADEIDQAGRKSWT